MAYWWDGNDGERYWCEITDRRDVGADLKCPQARENGKPDWSYSLIKDIRPGEVVFHYSTRKKAYVGASVASGPLEDRPIVWKSHGGNSDDKSEGERPGWYLPLRQYAETDGLPTLSELRAPAEDAWIRSWIDEREKSGRVYAPIQRYKGELRAAQGYLAKMPSDFVQRWSPLADLAQRLAPSGMAEEARPFVRPAGSVRLKDESDYVAYVRASTQVRSRSHERLVRIASERFKAMGAAMETSHPIDLKMTAPVAVLFEAKIVGEASALFAVRDAVGQLLEYGHFVGPQDAMLCVLLDEKPDDPVIRYIEDRLSMFAIWLAGGELASGPSTKRQILDPCARAAGDVRQAAGAPRTRT